MSKARYTPQVIRNKNATIILNALRRSPSGLPIRDLAERSGLSRTAIKKIIDSLLEDGLVVAEGKGDSTDVGGKRPEIYSVNKDASYTLILHVGERGFSAAIVDLGYKAIAFSNNFGEWDSTTSYVQAVEEVCAVTQELLLQFPRVLKRLAGLVILTSGVSRNDLGILIRPIQKNWGKNLPIVEDVKRILHLDCPIYLDNTVRLQHYYLYSQSASPEMQNSVLILYTSYGVGGSIMKSGALVHGSSGIAGEFGHIVTDYSREFTCSCGRNGCIESVVTHDRIVQRAKKLLPEYPDCGFTADSITFHALSDAADNGNSFAQLIMDFLVLQFHSLIYDLHLAADPDMFTMLVYSEGSKMEYFCQKLIDAMRGSKFTGDDIHLQVIVTTETVENIFSDPNSDGTIGAAVYCFDKQFSDN